MTAITPNSKNTSELGQLVLHRVVFEEDFTDTLIQDSSMDEAEMTTYLSLLDEYYDEILAVADTAEVKLGLMVGGWDRDQAQAIGTLLTHHCIFEDFRVILDDDSITMDMEEADRYSRALAKFEKAMLVLNEAAPRILGQWVLELAEQR